MQVHLAPCWSVYLTGFVGGAVWGFLLALALYQFLAP